jgi:hypothetical protein
MVGRPSGCGGGAECLSLCCSAVRKRRRRKARWSLEFGPLLPAGLPDLPIWVGREREREGGGGVDSRVKEGYGGGEGARLGLRR